MDILEYLIKDHDELRRKIELVGRFLHQSEFAGRFHSLLAHFELHEDIEEEIVFPRLSEAREADGSDVAFDYEKDHTALWRKLRDLRDSLNMPSSAWSRKSFRELESSLLNHMRCEEEILFPILRERISSDLLQGMGHAALARREEYLKQSEAAPENGAWGCGTWPEAVQADERRSKKE